MPGIKTDTYIVKIATHIEVIGFSVSLIAICISLAIYVQNRCLKNTMNRIHCCLFTVMLLQVGVRLFIYRTQTPIIRSLPGDESNPREKLILYVCQISIFILEYSISAVFTWMLIEGIYLNKIVTGTSHDVPFIYYNIVGWIVPLIITAIWGIFNANYYNGLETHVNCWKGYNMLPIYWILQGPRLAVIVVKFFLLNNIMRVLIEKLRHNTSSELLRMKKSVRASLILLPLLAITNVLCMMEGYATVYGVRLFEVWCCVTYFLRSFQGFFISIIYYFSNEEVKEPIKYYFRNDRPMRNFDRQNSRNSQTPDENESPPDLDDDNDATWIPMRDWRYIPSDTAGNDNTTAEAQQIGANVSSESTPTDNVIVHEMSCGYDRSRDPMKIFELVNFSPRNQPVQIAENPDEDIQVIEDDDTFSG